jgi:ornithine cyclodeaminase
MSDLLVVGGGDIAKIGLSPSRILEIVESSIAGIGTGTSLNPPKVSIAPVAKSMTIAMLAHVRGAAALGLKAYTEFPTGDGRSSVGSTITLFDDATGRPLAFMDGAWITAARTAAVTALFAREAATPEARVALVIGAGLQGREAIPALLAARPELTELLVLAPRQEAVERMISGQRAVLGGRRAHFCSDPAEAARHADIVIGAGGPGAGGLVTHAMLKPGATAILLGYGLAGDILHGADRVLATSEAQLHATGRDLADADGRFPGVDAELPDILLGRKPARTGTLEIVFAYNSGLAVTDVAVAKAVYDIASRTGAGQRFGGFR